MARSPQSLSLASPPPRQDETGGCCAVGRSLSRPHDIGSSQYQSEQYRSSAEPDEGTRRVALPATPERDDFGRYQR
jgi:hypothetical protein